MSNATEQVLLQIAENVERAVDDELQRVDDMNDDDFLLIRKKRIEQLKEVENRKSRWVAKGHGIYGEVPDPETFYRYVKESERVIVHFMRRSTPRCEIIERHLRLLAKEHFETRFCYVDCERIPSLPERFNVLMLPTLMLVEKQNTFHSIIGFDEFGGHDDFTTETVRGVLSQYGMINPNGMYAADQTPDDE